MKLGMLTQWYDPETGPAALPAVYAREFVKQGHQVSVLTGFPNYPEGRLYPGYSVRPRAREGTPALRVTRVALYPNHSRSSLGRLANYASFGLSATFLSGGALRDADATWVYNSPVTVSAPLLAHSRFGRTPIFLHVQDLWPDSLIESGMFPRGLLGKQVERGVAALVRLTERRAAVIGVSSRSVRGIILDRNPGIDPRKIVYAPNPTNEAMFRPVAETREMLGISPQPDGPVEVMYAGAIGDVQGLDVVLDAAALLGTGVRISLIGDGISRERLELRAEAEGLSNVRFLGRVPQTAIPDFIARAHIQLVSLADARFLSYTTPSKIAALLASGSPIVGHLNGDGARLIQDSGAGVAVRSGDGEALAAAIADMAAGGPESWRKKGAMGRAYYDENLSVASTTTTILNALTAATAQ